MRMNLTPTQRIVAAIGGGVLAAVFASPGLPAVAKSSPPKSSLGSIKLAKKAVLGLNGNAVQVSATVTCAGNFDEPGMGVYLSQGSGRTFADGNGWRTVICDGRSRTVRVTVPAYGQAFRTGTAALEANLYLCDSEGCNELTAARRISLVRS